jgi:cytoskeletal protein CcmA (bactofilin family)
MKPAVGSTVIGKSVIIRGNLSGNEDLYIDGDIEGTITLTESRLTIGPNARVRADITVRDVIVFGQLNGNVQATGRVDLRQSALVSGDILAGRLSIEESAVLKGCVELRSSAEVKHVPGGNSAPISEATASGTPLFPQPQV